MVTSKKTANEVYEVISEYVPDPERRAEMLLSITQVDGNKSFTDSIRMLLEMANNDVRLAKSKYDPRLGVKGTRFTYDYEQVLYTAEVLVPIDAYGMVHCRVFEPGTDNLINDNLGHCVTDVWEGDIIHVLDGVSPTVDVPVNHKPILLEAK